MLTIDQPAGGPLSRRVTRLSGWCLLEDSLPGRLEVFVDDEHAGRARLGLNRFDVADRCLSPSAVISGYEYSLDLSEIPDSTMEVSFRVEAFDQSSRLVERRERSFQLAGRAAYWSPAETAAPPASRRAPMGGSGRKQPGALKLAAFAHDCELGGAQLWLGELLRRSQAGSAFDCTVFSPLDGPLRESLERLGVTVEILPEESWRSREAYEQQVDELTRILAAGGYNAVLANTVLSLLGADAGRRAGCAVLWALHESWPPAVGWEEFFAARGVHPELRQQFANAAGGVDALIFACEATRRLYEPIAPPGRSVLIPYGVDVSAVERFCDRMSRPSARAALGFDSADRVLLVVGTLEPRKSQTLLAAAFAEVSSGHPAARMLMAGGLENDYTRALEAFIHASGLDGRVSVLPRSDDCFVWYRAADVLVSSSDVESMPRTMLEAMAFGLPIAAAAAYGVTELVCDGRTGWTFEPRDRSELSCALERVLTEGPARWAELGSAGRAKAFANFDSREYATDVVALMEGLLRDPGALPGEILQRAGRRPESRLGGDRRV